MKNLKRGSVLGGIILGVVFMGTIEAQAQENGENRGQRIGATTLSFEYDWGGLSALRTYVTTLIAQIEQSKLKIAQLEAALNHEISARQAADTILQNNINAIAGGGVTQVALDTAIASEAAAREAADAAETDARATADAALEGQIANEAAARQALADTVADLGDSVAPLASLAPLAPLATYVSVNTDTVNGLAGPHVIFSGANVHIQSGDGSGDSFTANGRGNLIVGFNEPSGYEPAERGGSHNVVVGGTHRYNFGTGLVVGYGSRLGEMGASVSGGIFNAAEGAFSSVTGGRGNLASGMFASVSGGENNLASGSGASVTGGVGNLATGDLSSVTGGSNNEASATSSTVGGGFGLANGTANTFIP
jgi:hypothetical protein